MFWLFLLFPALLMGHNAVDFHRPGFCAPYVNCLNYIVNQYAEMLEEKNNIVLVSQRVEGAEQIDAIYLTFNFAASYNLELSRNLMLQIIDSFVQTLYNDPRIQGVIPECGFAYGAINITLNFTGDCPFEYPAMTRIKQVVFDDNFLDFYIQNPANPCQLQILRREPIDFSRALYSGPLGPC